MNRRNGIKNQWFGKWLLGLFMLQSVLFVYARTTPPGFAVASAHPLATAAGLDILQQGGNAFDAAVAVSAALAVVEPYHSGLGGGGFWLLHDAAKNQDFFVDGREIAPAAATETMYLDERGHSIPGLSLNGGLAAAIPGEPAALVYISKRFGHLSLNKVLTPAIRLAETGFIVDPQLHYYLTMGDRAEQLKKYPASRAIFLKNGKPYSVGERLKQPDLANTLRLIAEQGHDGFYQGKIAERLVNSVNDAGGIWTLQDLASYKIKVRKPLYGQFHQMRIVTAPPPSAGGIGLLTMLNILAEYPLTSFSEVKWVHYLVESMRLAFWQRALFLGDSDFVAVDVDYLLSNKNTVLLRSFIHPNKATPSDSLPKQVENDTEHTSTTHFSILDAQGNRVSATLTINYIFGSSVVADGTGVLLNDEMDDFSIKPNEKNIFGLVGSKPNKIEPGKRPLSSMTPTFLDCPPHRLAILGTPGGSRIPTMVLIASLAFHDAYGAIKMVSEMRFHHQYLPDWLVFEPDTFSLSLQKELTNMGYQLAGLFQYYGDMQAITWDKRNQLITAASDPRHIGMASSITHNNSGGYGLSY